MCVYTHMYINIYLIYTYIHITYHKIILTLCIYMCTYILFYILSAYNRNRYIKYIYIQIAESIFVIHVHMVSGMTALHWTIFTKSSHP